MTESTLPPEAARRRAALESRWQRWELRTTAQLLDTVAAAHPDRPYVLTDERAWTYAELAAASIRLAAGLRANGIGPGDHVAVDLANFPQTVALKFAVARLGAVSVSINFLLRAQELGYVLRQSRAKLLVTMDHFRDLDYLAALDDLAPGWESGDHAGLADLTGVFVHPTGSHAPDRGRSLADLIESGQHIPDAEIRAHSDAADPLAVSDLLYTSGTTGPAKGAMLTHDSVLRTAYASAYTRAFDDGFRLLFALPIYHVFGYVEATIAALFVGGAICPQPSFDATAMLEAVARHRIDEMIAVPAMTTVLLEEARRGGHDLSSLRTMFSSGAAHRPGMFAEMAEVFGVEFLFTGYGQTETTASTMCTQPGDCFELLQTTNGCAKPAGIAGAASLGGTLAQYRVIDSRTGEQVPAGEIGELIVRGEILTAGYFDKPVDTAELIDVEGWLHTGDLGRMDAQGYLTLTGRQKESYRCGGELVLPSDVEATLAEFPGVAAAHVVGVPHERMGEVGCAWIVPVPGQEPDPQEIIAFCRERMARFKVPALVLFTSAEEIPLTVTGRVQKFQLVDRAVAELSNRKDS